LDVGVTDTPLFQATLSDVLLRARQDAARAQSRAVLAARRSAERAAEVEQQARVATIAADRRAAEATRLIAAAEQVAAQKVAQAQVVADNRIAEAERRAALLERQERVRRALIVEEVEERVRHELAHHAPPLPTLSPAPAAPADEQGIEVPSVPSVAEVFRTNPGVARFLDSLVGPT
jgi:hypothetical protein